MNVRRVAAVVGVCVVLAAARAEASGRGRHKKLYVVPPPGEVAVDGKLDDWDLSGQIYAYVVPETAEMQSARLAMMYDAEAVYISGVVRDTSPMMNRHDPDVDPGRAWDADVFQMFVSLDPDLDFPISFSKFAKQQPPETPVATLILWYFTDRKEANMVAKRGMRFSDPVRPDLSESGVIPRDKFKGAYAKSEDGGGYTFEYRIPWDTVGFTRPAKANDILAATLCVFWSRPDGLKTAGGKAWAYDVMARDGFPFQETGCYGKLIFREEGNVPRELVEEGLPPEKPLPLKFAYNVPEDSQVTVQLFDADNMVARLLVAQQDRRAGPNVELWDGMDDHGDPLPAGRYTWKGIAHQPITQKALFSPHNSGKPTYPTPNNRGGWGGDHGAPTDVARLPGGMLLAWSYCEYGWGIIRTDLDGKKRWGSKDCADHLAVSADGKRFFAAAKGGFHAGEGVKVYETRDARPVKFGNSSSTLRPPDGGDKENNHVTGLECSKNAVYVSFGGRDLVVVFDATSGEQKAAWPVPQPGALAACTDGSLVALSGGKLVRLSAGKVTPLAESHLEDPAGVAVAADGTIYVSDAGELQNVSVFSSDGTFRRSIGKPGGRPAIGRYDASGMYMPGGVELDEQGRVWVAETTDSPKRISVWDASTGANITEYFGACSYFGYGYIDPARPDEMYCHNVIWSIDWDNNACTPFTTIWRKTGPDMAPECSPDGYNGHLRVITANDGKQYALGGGRHISLLSMRDGDVFKPIAAIFHIMRGYVLYGGDKFDLIKDEKKYPNGGYLWQDANDDQLLQHEEIVRVTQRIHGLHFKWMEKDLTLWLTGAHVLKPVKSGEDGRPVYDIAKLDKTPLSGRREAGRYLWLDDEGSIYTMASKARPSLAKWTRDGKMLWGYPNIQTWRDALGYPVVKAGRLWGMTGPLGVSGGFTGNMTYFGVCHLFGTDGVYTAALMEDGRLGGKPEYIGQPEGQGGQFVTLQTAPGGPKRNFLICGGQDARVIEIFGLDTIEPLAGGVHEHTEEAVKLAAGAQAEYRKLIASSQRLTVARGRSALDLAQPVGKALEGGRSFEARAAYDADNLYVRFDVKSPYQLATGMSDPQLVFKGGNCLDIQLAADPDADAKRKKPAPGDLRLLVTRREGKPMAVVYRARVKDFAGEPITLKSPTGQESFDAIEPVEAVALDYRKNAEGFRATVTVPHAVTGWQPKPGGSVKMDVGYIFGNAGGSKATARAYWANNSFTANVLDDIPHESRLEPHEWGEAIVE